jgi:hypothetical protein
MRATLLLLLLPAVCIAQSDVDVVQARLFQQ